MCHYLNLSMWMHIKVLSLFAGEKNCGSLIQDLTLDCKTEEATHHWKNSHQTCMIEAAQLVLNNASANKLRQISLSNNTVKERIQDISQDNMSQVVKKKI